MKRLNPSRISTKSELSLKIVSSLLCKICYSIPYPPSVDCGACKYTYCQTCIHKFGCINNCYPTYSTTSKSIFNILNSYFYTCLNNECHELFNYESIREHDLTCQYNKYTCIYNCGNNFYIKDFQNHIKNECSRSRNTILDNKDQQLLIDSTKLDSVINNKNLSIIVNNLLNDIPKTIDSLFNKKIQYTFELINCKTCGKISSRLNFTLCEICTSNICKECISNCNNCSKLICIICSKCEYSLCKNTLKCKLCRVACESCNGKFCKEGCIKSCSLCKDNTCINCFLICSTCNEGYCKLKCSRECKICNKVTCVKCVNKYQSPFKYCQICKDAFCDGCFDDCITFCNRNICKRCILVCIECKIKVCKDCGFKCECGKFLCKSCDENFKIKEIATVDDEKREQLNKSNKNIKQVSTCFCGICYKKVCFICFENFESCSKCELNQCQSCIGKCSKCSLNICVIGKCSVHCYVCRAVSCYECSIFCVCDEVSFCFKCFITPVQITHECIKFINDKNIFNGIKTRSKLEFSLDKKYEIKLIVEDEVNYNNTLINKLDIVTNEDKENQEKNQIGNTFIGFTNNSNFLENTVGDIEKICVLKLNTGEVYITNRGTREYIYDYNPKDNEKDKKIIYILIDEGKVKYRIDNMNNRGSNLMILFEKERNLYDDIFIAFDLKKEMFDYEDKGYFSYFGLGNKGIDSKDKFYLYFENEGLKKERRIKILYIISIKN